MIIFHAQSVSENLRHLHLLAERLGIQTRLFDVSAYSNLSAAFRQAFALGNVAWVLDVESLSECATQDEVHEAADILRCLDVKALLFVTSSHNQTDSFIRGFSGGMVDGINRMADARVVSFPQSGLRFSRELSMQAYSRQRKEALVLRVRHGADLIMELDKTATFAHFHSGKARVFVWSTLGVFDLHRCLLAEREFEEAADEYIPAIIFLRVAFGDRCWHNPLPAAGIVIDDPLLKKHYGLIDFSQLLGSARRNQYHVTVAFIPWNYRRSRAKDMRLFREYSDCFSVCVHGCDHTNDEFKSGDYEVLLRKNFVARERMERHREWMDLACEPLMVCPQEQYSLEAMRAFADSRQFLCLVNTACMPRNLTTPQLRGADLLLPAQDSFFGFPIFKRHYFGNMSVFAMSLFLGKPAILVEHHDFFRNGPKGTEAFASGLAKFRSDLRWTPLGETVTRTHMRRRVSDGHWDVRFFTDIFRLEHEDTQPAEYRLNRRIPEETRVERIIVNGYDIPFSRNNGILTCQVRFDRPQSVNVRVVVAPVEPREPYPASLRYHASVALRRGLSELRDNFVARNRFALAAGKSCITILKRRKIHRDV